jgi:DNA-binding SARP family transcriptional activator
MSSSDSSGGLELRVLGPLEALLGGSRLRVSAPLERRLLSLLLLRRSEVSPQSQLIEELWAGAPPPTARASLQNLIHALRRRLGREAIVRLPAGYRLDVPAEVVDLDRFRHGVSAVRDTSPLERAAGLRDALALWRGPAFQELRSDTWAQGELARLDEERLTALEDRIEADLELGAHAGLVPELQELVMREATRERLWFQLMLALYRSGRQADALEAYSRARDAFVGQLGIEPGVVLRELQRAVLVQDRALDDPTQALGSTLERAAAILPRAPRERAESLLDYGAALIRIGELRQAAPTVEAAERFAESAGERGIAERARILLSYLDVFAEGGSLLEHLAVAERAAEVFRELADDAGLALALLNQAHVRRDTGRAETGLGLAVQGARSAAAAGDRVAEVRCRRMAASCAALGPTPVLEALAVCDAADEAGESGDPTPAADARAWLLAQAGAVREARAVYEKSLGTLRERGIVLSLAAALAYAGLAERSAGELDRAAGHLRTAHALVRAHDIRGDVSVAGGELACVLALRGDVDEARRLAEEARSAPVHGDLPSDVLWRRALALVAALNGRLDEALSLSEEVREILGATDWLTIRADALEEDALVRRLSGDARGRGEALEEALDLYEQKGNVAGAARVRERLAR